MYASTTSSGFPSITTCPCVIQITRVHISRIVGRSCATITISRAVPISSFIRARAFWRNARSPTASTSSISSTSGSTAVAIENASRISIPLE